MITDLRVDMSCICLSLWRH